MIPHSNPPCVALIFGSSPNISLYNFSINLKISELVLGLHPGYPPEKLTSNPHNSKVAFKVSDRFFLLESNAERVKHKIFISPSPTTTLATLLEVSVRPAISGLILYTPL